MKKCFKNVSSPSILSSHPRTVLSNRTESHTCFFELFYILSVRPSAAHLCSHLIFIFPSLLKFNCEEQSSWALPMKIPSLASPNPTRIQGWETTSLDNFVSHFCLKTGSGLNFISDWIHTIPNSHFIQISKSRGMDLLRKRFCFLLLIPCVSLEINLHLSLSLFAKWQGYTKTLWFTVFT